MRTIKNFSSMIAALALATLVGGCTTATSGQPGEYQSHIPETVQGLRQIGQALTIARTASGPAQHFGGISGMDWDSRNKLWYFLSDDRSALAPARFYEAEVTLNSAGIDRISIARAMTILQSSGQPYPGKAGDGEVPDPEALRMDPAGASLWWSSEGDRSMGLHPFVRNMDKLGRYLGEQPLPANLRVHPHTEMGARNNQAIEGLAFSPDGSALWTAMEGPVYQDGEPASQSRGAWLRFTRHDRSKGQTAQYAYPLDAIAATATGGKKRSDNGVSEILATGCGELLVIERSGYEVGDGVFRFAIRIYVASFERSTDILNIAALRDGFTPMTKRLVLDLKAAGIDADNIEAAAWGPRLPDGHASLLLASDDNFSPHQSSQFLLFEVIEQ
ncbi:MAG: esterase-like activity of phytase family protein [Pseudomonadota bacterium]